jgi:spermidine/putrescine transport system substrate-binding protein
MSKKDICVNMLKDKIAEGKMSRREFTTLLGAAGIGLSVTPMRPRPAFAAADDATYYTWGGYDIPELFAPYIEKHGAPPSFAAFGGTEEALTKLIGGYVIDVAHPCNASLPRWISSGLWQPIDTSRLSNWGDVVPSLKNLDGATQGDDTYFAPFDWGQTSITYRTDLVDWEGQEESWGLLFDPRYEGRLGVIASAGDTWWCTAIYAGVPFTEMHTDENYDKVAALLRQQRPLIREYTDDMTTLEQMLASGELAAAMTWNSSPVELKKQDVPVAFANPKEGALTWVCGMVLHKDAANVDLAHDIIDSLLSTETGNFLIDDYGYGHSNMKSFSTVSAERLAELGLSTNPDDILSAGKFQVPLPEEFTSKMNETFEEIKAGF